MARGRMLDSSIWDNEKFGALPMGAQLLQIGMINHADDQGRVKANPLYLSKAIFLYNEEVTLADIRKWLELLHANGTILLYAIEDKQYAQHANWWKYQTLQYAQPSEYPRPEGWQDRIRRTVTKTLIATCNWVKVNGEPVPDTCDMDGKLLPGRPGRPAPPFTPESNPPSPNGASPYLPDDSGEYSPDDLPDDSGERATYSTNLTELNLTKGEGIDTGTPARVSADKPTAPPPPKSADPEPLRRPGWSGKQNTGHRLRAKACTIFDPRKLVGGFVPKGTGENGTEVYLEFHPLDKQNPPSKTAMEMMNEIDDLSKWRQVLEKCTLKGWQPRNIDDRLDAYRNGFRHERNSERTDKRSNLDGYVDLATYESPPILRIADKVHH